MGAGEGRGVVAAMEVAGKEMGVAVVMEAETGARGARGEGGVEAALGEC